MEGFLDQKTVIGAVAGLIVGLLVGWLLIGWTLWPVTWTETDPVDLRQTHKETYISMVADSYVLDTDLESVRKRLVGFSDEEIGQTIAKLVVQHQAAGKSAQAQRLQTLATALQLSPEQVATPVATAAPVAGVEPSPIRRLLPICLVFLLAFVGVGGVILAATRLRGGELARLPGPTVTTGAERLAAEPRAYAVPGVTEADLGHFVTTYNLGDDGYDTSFSIETAAGEFLGECGVGISETLGEGTPDMVTAFEVWLFDKNDIKTVTNVLMSNYAYNDQDIRNKLAPRGDPVLAQQGRSILLETQSLRVEAGIADMAYGTGGGLPSQSFFEKLTIQMVPSLKEEAGERAMS
ncbi:MAG: hypothetical protein ACE5NP_06105 [Anaerolineae bacterium]